MDWGAFRTRFEGWSRGPALALIAALLALLAVACWSPAAAPLPRCGHRRPSTATSSSIATSSPGLAAGGNYYQVAADELRKGNYPLKPFFTFRLPTHATIYAAFGERAMIVVVLAAVRRPDDCLVDQAETTACPCRCSAAALVLIAGGLGGLLAAADRAVPRKLGGAAAGADDRASTGPSEPGRRSSPAARR